MARLARSFVRLVVVLVLAGALVTAAVGSIAYSTGRLFHDVAAAKETPIPDLVTDSSLPSVIYAANGSVMATLRSSLYRQPVGLAQISPDPDQGRPRHRGPQLLVPRGPGRRGDDPGAVGRRKRRSGRPGRLDHRPAAGQGHVLDGPEDPRAARYEKPYWPSASRRSTPRHRYWTLISTRSTWAAAPTASRPRPRSTSTRMPDQLDLAQAALLAGLIQAPSAYDPIDKPRGGAPAAERGPGPNGSITSRFRPPQAAAANEVALADDDPRRPGCFLHIVTAITSSRSSTSCSTTQALGTTLSERESALFPGASRYIRTRCRRCSRTPSR